MKVLLEENYKDMYTISDLERAKEIIKEMKEDEETAKGYAEIAIGEALKESDDYLKDVLVATARTAKNCRAFNNYSNHSYDMDVWVEAVAETWDGFIKVGAYLTDIWQAGSFDYKEHMYIRYFKEVTA